MSVAGRPDGKTRPGVVVGELPEIPLIDLGARGPGALLDECPERAERLIASGRRMLTPLGLRILERGSRAWAERANSPFLPEIRDAAGRLPTGSWFMNMCYEWGCTTGVSPGRAGARMLRTLDWPFEGLGRELVVARHESKSGPWYNVTWPGYVGVLTVMAPGRFAIAINQAPMRRRRYTPMALDWAMNRAAVWRSADLPPAHLLRLVCETCRDYESARAMLAETPLALPVFFTLAGNAPEEGCVIERLEASAIFHEAPAAIANHWIDTPLRGKPRGRDSVGRLSAMVRYCNDGDDVQEGFDWVAAPILNPDTRLAVIAEAASGTLRVQGWEADGPATAVFDLERAA